MKKWFKIMVAATLALAAWSCGEPEKPAEPQLPITSANIAGVWQLTEWQGEAVSEDMVVYIDFVNVGRTYTLYQNLDSHQLRTITGSYFIETDAEYGAIIRGNYDYGNGDWAHRYIVTDLTANRMVWTAKDNADDVSVYVRTELPEGFKPAEE